MDRPPPTWTQVAMRAVHCATAVAILLVLALDSIWS